MTTFLKFTKLRCMHRDYTFSTKTFDSTLHYKYIVKIYKISDFKILYLISEF